MSANADLIAKWREENPGTRLDLDILAEIVGVGGLWSADLRGADLWSANLRYADLRDADLWNADLRNADLRGAALWSANLRYADLRDADLRGADFGDANLRNADLRNADLRGAALWSANLRSAHWHGLQVNGLPSGQVTLAPTCNGWALRVGCWIGTIDGLEALVAGDDWPEATGEEILRRRPLLTAAIALCRAHIESNPGVIEQLAEKWAKSEVQA